MNEKLRSIRKKLHLSQEFVAKQMQLSRTAITKIEAGERTLTADEFVKFSELYHVSMEEIAYGQRTI